MFLQVQLETVMIDILIRLFEMKQSILIIEQCLDNIPFGPIKSSDNKVLHLDLILNSLWNL
jgi:NADH:ubiquinone oxidoreductase subunit D